MAEPQPSKLVMRVRFPSPAPPRKPRSPAQSGPPARSLTTHPASAGPQTGHVTRELHFTAVPRPAGSHWSPGAAGPGRRVRWQCLVAISGRVLVDRCRTRARMPQPTISSFRLAPETRRPLTWGFAPTRNRPQTRRQTEGPREIEARPFGQVFWLQLSLGGLTSGALLAGVYQADAKDGVVG